MKYLITSALPYANGPLHFGHIGGVYLPADIYFRHKKIMGDKVIHICGSDEHGVAIMLSAEKEGCDYRSYVDRWHENHKLIFKKYGIEFDFFGRTSSEYHKEETLKWFDALYKKGYIESKPENQLYCNNCPRYLPDRYVEGTCYNCGKPNARGDECPSCGEWIDSLKLINPHCKICGSKDISIKESTHWYLMLTKLEKIFKPWFNTKKSWRPHVWEYVNSLLSKGLIDRAITRDLTWGIDVPLPEAKGKKFYVWFDAPIGYVSNTKEYLRVTGSKEDYIKDWWKNPETQIIHFIGKDNIIFHGLIWPCMVLGSDRISPPTDIPASHFVNLEGKQFSKSTGWYVDSEKTIDTFGEDAMRFYLSSIVPENGDTNFSWDSFININNELANKIGNFINRSTSFMAKHWPEGISANSFKEVLNSKEFEKLKVYMSEFREALEKVQTLKAHSILLRMGETANETFHLQEPWKTIKTDKAAAEKTIALSIVYILGINSVFRPFLPLFSTKLFEYFKPTLEESVLDSIYRGDYSVLEVLAKSGFKLSINPAPLLPRIDPKQVDLFRLNT